MEKSLLSRLQSALNDLYEGNTLISSHRGESHVDQYKCDCSAIVKEDEWNFECKVCKECYSEMMCDHGHRWGAI